MRYSSSKVLQRLPRVASDFDQRDILEGKVQENIAWGVGLITAVLVAGGCSASTSNSVPPVVLKYAPSQTINLAVGQELEITVGTLGPGSYGAPTISSAAVVQVPDYTVDSIVTPGGPTQHFRFMAQGAGQAVITLGQSGRTTFHSDTVRDTVIVR